MKRFLAVLTTLLLALSLAACGGKSENHLQDTVDSILSKEEEENSSQPPFAVGNTQPGQSSEPPQDPPVPPDPPTTDPPANPTDIPAVPSEARLVLGDFSFNYHFKESGAGYAVAKLGNQMIVYYPEEGEEEFSMYFGYEKVDDGWKMAVTYEGDLGRWQDINDADPDIVSEEEFINGGEIVPDYGFSERIGPAGIFYLRLHNKNLNYRFEGVRYEEVNGIRCAVYKDTARNPSYYWVEPETGFTLKYQDSDGRLIQPEYEKITSWPLYMLDTAETFPIQNLMKP